jgi:hypothetical protein
MSEQQDVPRQRCINLCCKSMLVYGEHFEMDPEYQGDLTEFWCQLTAKGLGPDANYVSLSECSNPERECYKEY